MEGEQVARPDKAADAQKDAGSRDVGQGAGPTDVEQDDVAPRDDVRVLSNRCPFCHEDVARDATEIAVCGACMARHHDACWSERRACGTCGVTRRLVPAPSLTDDQVVELMRQGWRQAAVAALRDRGLGEGEAGGQAFKLATSALAEDRRASRMHFAALLGARAGITAAGAIVAVALDLGNGLTVGTLGLLATGAFLHERGPLRRLARADVAIAVMAVIASAIAVNVTIQRGLGLGDRSPALLWIGLVVAAAQALLAALAARGGRSPRPPAR